MSYKLVPNEPFTDQSTLKSQMKDKTDEVMEAVGKYEGFEFVPLRIEDAFDSSWWARVGERDKLKEHALGVDFSDEGMLIDLYSSNIIFNS